MGASDIGTREGSGVGDVGAAWQLTLPGLLLTLSLIGCMRSWKMTTDWITAIATAVQAGAVLGALGYAARQVQEARRAREDQTRPYVVVDLDLARRFQFPYLVIANVGRSEAVNVQFEFDQPIESAMYDTPNLGGMAAFRDGIPVLVPGREIATLFDHMPARANKGLPMLYGTDPV